MGRRMTAFFGSATYRYLEDTQIVSVVPTAGPVDGGSFVVTVLVSPFCEVSVPSVVVVVI